MDFSSDNAWGALPAVLAALARVNDGPATAYGGDAVTAGLTPLFGRLFETELALFPVATGTAANALALAALTPPEGAVLCHAHAHILESECGAPEFYAQGARLTGLPGDHGKLTASAVIDAIAAVPPGNVHIHQPRMVSLSQPTELGTLYTSAEIAAIASAAHARGLKVHMDGARLANAVAALNVSPADLTWRAGVDVLSFGASKGGTLGAEAVIFFHPSDAKRVDYARKRGGHLISKMRFLSAQLEAFVTDGLWLTAAARANALATRLGEGLGKVPGVTLAAPVQTNMVFAHMPQALAERLRAAGAVFHDWMPPRDGRVLIRLALSFATPEADVSRLLEIAAP